jgi:septal ring factor EnvC (AmiA/AmiB activator)
MLASLVLGHAEPAPGWALAALASAAVLAAALAWALARNRKQREAVAAQDEALEQARAETRATGAREADLQRRLEEKRDELVQAKKDLAAQKKRAHGLQEDLKGLRHEITDVRSVFETARNARPAFAEPEIVPEPVTAPPPPPPPPSTTVQDLRDRATSLEEQNAALLATCATAGAEVAALQDALTQMEKRIEDYRRIDIMTKNKAELLEDKLRQMGARYYDAVSELARERGEVPNLPPAPGVVMENPAETAA